MESKAKSAAKAKQNAAISSTLGKLESTISALSAKVEANDAGAETAGGVGPAAGGGGLGPAAGGGPKPDSGSPPPPPPPAPPSPEQDKMQKSMEDLAGKLQEVSDKIENEKASGGSEIKMSPELAASQQRLGDQLSGLGESVGKLIGEMQSIKDAAKMNKAALEAASGASKTPLGKAAKMVEQSQIAAALNQPNSNSQKVNQVLSAVKDAATAAGLTASVLGKVISNGGAVSAQQGSVTGGATASGAQQGTAGGNVPNMDQATAVANALTLLGAVGSTNSLIGGGNSAFSNSLSLGGSMNGGGGSSAAGAGGLANSLSINLGAGGAGLGIGGNAGGKGGGGSSGGSAGQNAMMGAAGAIGALNAMSNAGGLAGIGFGGGNGLIGLQGIGVPANNDITNGKSREVVELPDISSAFENLLGTLSRRDLKGDRKDQKEFADSLRKKIMELEKRGRDAARNPTPLMTSLLRQEVIKAFKKMAPYSSRIKEYINTNMGSFKMQKKDIPTSQNSDLLKKDQVKVGSNNFASQSHGEQKIQKATPRSIQGIKQNGQYMMASNDARKLKKLVQVVSFLKGQRQEIVSPKLGNF